MDRARHDKRHEKTKKEFVPHTRSSHVITANNSKANTLQKPKEHSSAAYSHKNGNSISNPSTRHYANEKRSIRVLSPSVENASPRQNVVANERQHKDYKSTTPVYQNLPPNSAIYIKHRDAREQPSERVDENRERRERSKKRETTDKDIPNHTSKEPNHIPATANKSGKIPIRRSASIDVGELNRKKRGKRKKKGPVDKEAIIAQAKSQIFRNDGDISKKRSGSVGNRPTSLKLSQSNSSQNFFPTPTPQKRLTRSSKSDLEKLTNNSHYQTGSSVPDPVVNEKTAILPNKQPIPSISINIYDEDDDDDELLYAHEFPTGEGYRKHGRKLNFPSSPYFRLKPTVIKRLWVRIVGLVLYSILAFMVFCPFVVFILVCLPIFVMIKISSKCCSTCCCRLNQGEDCACCICGQGLSLSEKFWIQNERKDHNVAQSLIIVEYGLSVAQIVNLVNNRIVLCKDEKGNRMYPRFSQKIVRTCVNYVWKEDRDFFIHNHVFSMPKGIESLEDLQDYISDYASRGLTFERPLWELHVLTDFGDLRDTVLLFRMHPCLSDGVSMVRILYKSFADVDSTTTVPLYMGRESYLDKLKSFFYGPLHFLSKFTISRDDFNLLHGKHVHLSGKKVITWSEPYSLTKATRIKQVTRSTLGEVLMSVAAGSIRNYFILNGISHPYDIQSSIPVYHSTSTCQSGVTNNVIMVKVTLPTNTEGVVPRLWQMKDSMCRLRESSVFSLTRRIFQVSNGLFADSCWHALWTCFLRKCSCIVSSLPGPEINLRLSSKEVKTIFYWFPPIHNVALSISFFTYGDQLQMTVSADRTVLPNPELIAKDFIYQMQSLYDLLAHRRIPGEHVNKKVDLALLNNEIRPEESAEQVQKRMLAIHQEIQNLKHKMDGTKFGEAEASLKLMKKIEALKEQFRELLVEVRQRKAAEAELAIAISEDDSNEDDDDFDLPRRPFRRRAMSVSSRLSNISVSSTMRPLAATPGYTPAVTPDYSPDSPLISHLDRKGPFPGYGMDSRSPAMRPFSSLRSNRRQTMQEFEILEYQYSPSMERRYKKKH